MSMCGFKDFLRNVKTDNLVLCDVLCGGNVSPGFFKSYLNYIENVKTIRRRGFVSEQKNWVGNSIIFE